MTGSRQDLIRATVQAQERFVQNLLVLTEPDWLALDLTLSQLKSLMVLVKNDACPIHQLATTLRIGRPAASALVEQLVRLGLVQRMEDPRDRRRTLVCLTAEGTAFITRLRQGREEGIERILATLPDEDLTTLARIFSTLAQVAQASP